MLAGRGALGEVVSTVASQVSGTEIDAILAVDARGFILGASLADRLGCGFIMVRKPGKLPGDVLSFEYSCEYCSGTLEVTAGLIGDGLRCLIADDLLATGGTARATGNFVKSQGGEIAGYAFILEIEVLKGRRQLDDAPVISAMTC
ncbi:adenine phosphoribosyltransferase [Rhizobium azibense]|nr:adenine phosphoribosyltransferase [Rhizobium sp. Pop5]OHV21265.1 adenine phosphoribosyltransferase [Rhizobium sp. RSm-3]OWV79153.1 adenine phosphoribosyltransferase [Rhizobium sp. N122]PON04166.1 adenine phosphoribosyltransferase [Rhizobium hidalgonense]TCU14596.1 adenine phosphoribosyltransferase [Rhizobium azibense]SCB61318.1 adenine phosphoribosyltransferase [Rhizobium aethiopicum]